MHPQFTPKQIARFWARVDQSGDCWEWIGYRMPKGYGALFLKNERASTRWYPVGMTAHRFSWILHHGPIPDGMSVCHHCDNRACVRPEHLWLGTNGDNVRDMFAKGRGGHYGSPGEANNHAKLNEAQVYAMRARYRVLIAELAETHGVTRSLIRQILSGKVWAHLAEPSEVPQ